MLRPDFTVPVVQMHMAYGAEPARYTYAGEVFRRQEDDSSRANEYTQVGYEVFDRENPAAADAEVFALVRDAVAHLDLRAATGDIGLLAAAVAGLDTTERRKAALTRHLWRPRRFRALLDRFAKPTPETSHRARLAQDSDPFAAAGPMIGLRSQAEIEARIAAIKEDIDAAPISKGQVELIDSLLAVRETLPYALERLRDIAVDLPAIEPAVLQLARRIEALAARGVDVDSLDFEASFGRTSMEYYDGFVFGFYSDANSHLPAVATGGRYDALTRVLGQGNEIPAVGGVIRPEVLLTLEGAI
jgi:ATP phosphoribosyltransferase regulatory subunit